MYVQTQRGLFFVKQGVGNKLVLCFGTQQTMKLPQNEQSLLKTQSTTTVLYCECNGGYCAEYIMIRRVVANVKC